MAAKTEGKLAEFKAIEGKHYGYCVKCRQKKARIKNAKLGQMPNGNWAIMGIHKPNVEKGDKEDCTTKVTRFIKSDEAAALYPA